MEKTCATLLEYWQSLCSEAGVPRRETIEPKAIKSILPNVYILDAQSESDDEMVYRLAGTTLCARYGGELRGTAVGTRWGDDASRRTVMVMLRQCQRKGTAVYLHSRAELSNCGIAALETIIAPLRYRDFGVTRFIGATHVSFANPRAYFGTVVSQHLLLGAEVSGRHRRASLALPATSAPKEDLSRADA